MNAWKPRKGTYEIDRVFPSLGRVRLRTGTHDRRRAQQYELLLEMLPLETVRLIAERRISLRVAYDAWAAGRAAELPTAQMLLLLADELPPGWSGRRSPWDRRRVRVASARLNFSCRCMRMRPSPICRRSCESCGHSWNIEARRSIAAVLPASRSCVIGSRSTPRSANDLRPCRRSPSRASVPGIPAPFPRLGRSPVHSGRIGVRVGGPCV